MRHVLTTFLELIASDARKLDVVTDKIFKRYKARADRGGVEASTFIVAKAHEEISILSEEESLVFAYSNT